MGFSYNEIPMGNRWILMLKRLWINKNYIWKIMLKTVGVLSSGIAFFSVVIPESVFFDSSFSVWGRFLVAMCLMFALIMAGVIYGAYKVLWSNRCKVFKLHGQHYLYIQYGDVFLKSEGFPNKIRRNIVIPVNRCFDTIVDDNLVSSNTLHGIAITRILQDGSFTQRQLDKEIQKDLSQQEKIFIKIDRADKRSGNLKRYPVGTVAMLRFSDDCNFFLLGLSTFGKDLKAETTDEDYLIAMEKLLDFCNVRAQGYPVIMPLIGAGMSRTKKDEMAILSYMIGLIRLKRTEFNFDIHIVVREIDNEEIPIFEFGWI